MRSIEQTATLDERTDGAPGTGAKGGEAPSADETAAGAQDVPAAEEQAEAPAEPGHTEADEFGECARGVTQHILDLMGLDLTAVVTEADRHQVNLDLEGEDTRIIIGKHGQTLEALQQIVALIANKETPRRFRVFIDAEGYQQRRRERREQELVEMARADALRAKEMGQEAVIQYAVGPYERRVIHMAFVDDPEFVTYSEGEEPHRYVVISPRD